MVISINSTRTFHRNLYSGLGMLKTVTLLKRSDNLAAGTVRAITLYEARRSSISKQGQQIALDETVQHRTVWHFWRVELDRVGVSYINSLDIIVETVDYASGQKVYWQPESDTLIEEKLFQNAVDIACKRVDPPAS